MNGRCIDVDASVVVLSSGGPWPLEHLHSGAIGLRGFTTAKGRPLIVLIVVGPSFNAFAFASAAEGDIVRVAGAATLFHEEVWSPEPMVLLHNPRAFQIQQRALRA